MGTIDQEVKTRFANNRQRFITNLFFTSNHFQNMFTDILRPYDLSIPQLNILRILRGAGKAVTMNNVKTLMIDKAPNLTRLTDKLLAKKLIARQRSDQDRRVVYISVSKEGMSLLEKIDNDEAFNNLNFLERISEEEAKHFSNLLDRIRE
ncbi:MAG: MarR family transcriptional regulator [Bacteroidia bacterium]|nr:MarR family transcriptional regulator [Bacteroidia bacterium]